MLGPAHPPVDEGHASGHTHAHTPFNCRFIRIKALQLPTAIHPLRGPTPSPTAPPAPLDAPKLKIEANPREAIVTEGETVTMTCQVLSSNPGYQNIAWLKDGTLLRGQETLMLTLSTVTKEMSGKYQCEASNEIGLGQSEEVDLQVYCEPPGSWEGGRQGVSSGWNQGPGEVSKGGPGSPPSSASAGFFQMLRNLPGLRSSPHQLRREIKYR